MISTWSKLSRPRSFMKWEDVSSCVREKWEIKNDERHLGQNPPPTAWGEKKKKEQLTWGSPSQGWSCRRAWGRTWRGRRCSLRWGGAGPHTVGTARPLRAPGRGGDGIIEVYASIFYYQKNKQAQITTCVYPIPASPCRKNSSMLTWSTITTIQFHNADLCTELILNLNS